MAKRAQQGSGEERVTAKSRPMMNLTARMPSVVSSSTSSNLGRTSYGYQDPGKSVASDDRSGNLRHRRHQVIQKRLWSILVFSEWKSGAAAHDRSGKPEKTSLDMMQQVAPHREEPLPRRKCAFRKVRRDDFMMDRGNLKKLIPKKEQIPKLSSWGSDAAEFVDKVKDQVRNRQKRMSSIAESCTEHSIIWGMFMAATMNAATFMGKNFSTIQSFIKNYEDLTLKQMFDVTAQLVNDRKKSMVWTKFSGKRILGNVCH